MRAACLLSLLALPASAQEADGGSALEFSAAYTGDLRRNTTGGIAPGTAYADEIDLGIAWESDRVFPGAKITSSLAVMYLGGDAISAEFVGDLQGLNNLEAPSGWPWQKSQPPSNGTISRANAPELRIAAKRPTEESGENRSMP